ncbi:DUF305 domain-containing protein [Agromyces sp. NPDC055520]
MATSSTPLSHRSIVIAPVIALAAVVGLAGCASAVPTPGSTAASVSAGSSVPADVNDADLHFLGMMTPHHEQAVVMSDIVLAADGVSAATLDLAERIKQGQLPEIDTMVGWLGDWGRASDLDVHRTHVMGGMLTPEQMAAFEAANGAEAELLFLTGMLQHHEGAIAMTQDAIDNGGYPDSVALAEQMMRVQSAEIDEMRALLAERS